MKKRLLSLVLCLVMVFSLLPFAGFAAKPVTQPDGTVITNPDAVVDGTGNLHLSKTLAQNQDNGTYSINLESFATADVSTVTTTEKIPTDFIVIVDQSGSMATTDMAASKDSYTKVTGSTYPDLETVAEGRYYYKDEATGQYYRVYGKHGYLYYKYPANTRYANDFYGTSLFYYFSDETTTASGANGYYYYNTEDKAWYPISMAVEGHLIGEQSGMLYECRFSYDRNGTKVALPYSSSRSYHAYRQLLWNRIEAGSDKIVYDFYRRYIGYNGLFYRDINGVEHAVPTVTGETTTNYCTSNGANAVTTENGSQQMRYNNLYTLKSGSANVKTRLEALTQALNEFSSAVAAETDTFGAVDNKVAIVGFSSEGYKNTEILTGSDIGYRNNGSRFSEGSYYFPYKGQYYDNATNGSGGATNYTGPQYYNESGTGIVRIDNTHYKNALISANNGTAGTVNPDLTKAIKSIGAYGGTQPADGFDMAANIIQQRATKQYTLRSGEHKGEPVNRNVIVIYFTDGRPGNNSEVDQYAEANLVVNKAKTVKEMGASVFSIGVFGESDANPLTYSKYDSYTSEDDGDAHLYLLDFVRRSDLVRSENYGFMWGNTRYYHNYYYRYWISGQQTAYGDTPNDTIYDYMSVVSSNYPGASYFMDSNWNSSTESWKDMTARVRGNSIGQNSYYRMASNQDTLVAAFEAAVTMIHTNTDEQQTVTLDSTAILRDTVNTTALDVTGATYTARRVPIKYDKGNFTEDTSRTATVITGHEIVPVPSNGQINVDGFNYKDDRTSATKPEGWKLVVTISGLVPKQMGTQVDSNVGNAGIYGPSTEKPAVSIASPKLITAGLAKTYVIDYNYPVKLTESLPAAAVPNVTINGERNNFAEGNTASAKSGTYTVNGQKLTYQLFTGSINPDGTGNNTLKATVDLKPYGGVDTALFYESTGWKQVKTLPATSVYYADSLKAEKTTLNGDGSESGATSSASPVDGDKGKQITYTFKGTGIDIYNTASKNAGYVVAQLYKTVTDEATGEPKLEKVGSQSMKNYVAEGTRVNVPSIFFSGLDYDTYTLKLTASKGANFQIDGIRVYNPAGLEAEDASIKNEAGEVIADLTTDANDIYSADNRKEQNATFTNLRKLLLATPESEATAGIGYFSDTVLEDGQNTKTVTVADLDANGNLQFETKDGKQVVKVKTVNVTPPTKAAYEYEGPKNEIYLEPGDAIGFTISNENWETLKAKGLKLMIGISSPNSTSAAVLTNNNTDADNPVNVTQVDSYYDVTPTTGNTVWVQNASAAGSGVLIALSKLKLSGTDAIVTPAASAVAHTSAVEDKAAAPEEVQLELVVNDETIEYAANYTANRMLAKSNALIAEYEGSNTEVEPSPIVTPEPTPEVTPAPTQAPSVHDIVKQIVSSFVSNLFRSISRLFGN